MFDTIRLIIEFLMAGAMITALVRNSAVMAQYKQEMQTTVNQLHENYSEIKTKFDKLRDKVTENREKVISELKDTNEEIVELRLASAKQQSVIEALQDTYGGR